MGIHRADTAAYGDQAPGRLRWAQAGARALRREELALHVLDDEDDPAAPVIELRWLPPGHVLSRRFHASHRFEKVLTGTATVEGQTFGPGDILAKAPTEEHGLLTAGPGGCVSLEIFADSGGVLALCDVASVDAERRALHSAAARTIRGPRTGANRLARTVSHDCQRCRTALS